jgi:hypothetical protein
MSRMHKFVKLNKKVFKKRILKKKTLFEILGIE